LNFVTAGAGMVARFGPKAGWKGFAKTEVQPLWRGKDHENNHEILKIQYIAVLCAGWKSSMGGVGSGNAFARS